MVDESRGLVCEVKVGSSEGGNKSNDATHHPERGRRLAAPPPRAIATLPKSYRRFASGARRHSADVHLSATARGDCGVLATAHLFVKPGVGEKEIWRAYRQVYRDEPFVRIVKEKTGIYRYPEPKTGGRQQLC